MLKTQDVVAHIKRSDATFAWPIQYTATQTGASNRICKKKQKLHAFFAGLLILPGQFFFRLSKEKKERKKEMNTQTETKTF